MTHVTFDALHLVDGSIVLFEATDEHGCHPLVAVDRHYAPDIAQAIRNGEAPEADVERWQIIGEVRP